MSTFRKTLKLATVHQMKKKRLWQHAYSGEIAKKLRPRHEQCHSLFRG